jgi:putative ABC transport system permease protein
MLALDSTGSLPRWRGRRYLIGMQVAVSVLLVALATLFAGEVRRQSQIDTGIDLERLALAQIDFGPQRYEEGRVRQLAEAALGQMARRPDVAAVALASGLPVGLTGPIGASMRALDGSGAVGVGFVAAMPAVFDTLGVAIVRGRGFDQRDTRASAPVIVLSAIAAEQLFADGQAIGREVVFERRRAAGEPQQAPKTLTVIGITTDTDVRDVGRRDSGVAYLPLDQHYEPNLVMAVRAAGDPASLVAPLRSAIAAVDPELAVSQVGTGLALAGPNTTFQRTVAWLASVLGMMALVLALAGLYGVLSYIVAGRTREIGLRLALGASTGSIRRMVIRQGLGPVLLGLAGGLGLGLIARAAMQPLFLRIVPSVDVTLMVLVPVLFIGAGLVACYLPALRAAHVDPNVALRHL